jgi:hypothetical protein
MAITRFNNSNFTTGNKKFASFDTGYPALMAAPTATAGSAGSASVAFTAQTGATSYGVISSPGNVTATGTSSPITVSGLTPGVSYTFRIRPINSVGTGVYSSASNSVTIVAANFLANTASLDDGFGSQYTVRSTFVDSSGNHFAAGAQNVRNWFMGRTNTGSNVFQALQTWSVGTPIPNAITEDVNGNIIVAGQHSDGTNFNAFIQSFNSTMTSANWRLLFRSNDSSGVVNTINGLTTDSSGNIYAVGTSDTGTGFQAAIIMKLNSSGTVQWQKKLQINNRAAVGRGIALDSSGNIYITGDIANVGSTKTLLMYAKYNNSGTLQVAYTETGSSDRYGRCIFVDSSGNIYVVGFMSSYIYVSKMDSSFNVLWRDGRTYGSPSPFGLWVDSTSNVYVSGWAFPTDRYIGWWIKYNSSGSVQLQRSITSNSNTIQWISTYENGITPNDSTIVLTARVNGSSASTSAALQVPTDGSKTGTYTFPAGYTSNNISYAALTATGTDTTAPTQATFSPSDLSWSTTTTTGVTYSLSTTSYTNGVLNI